MSVFEEDPTNWIQSGTIDPELEQILQTRPPALTKNNDITALASTREQWAPKFKAGAHAALEATNGRVLSKEIHIPRRDGASSRALLYRPSDIGKVSGRPLVVLIHGGGFCFGSPEMEGGNCIRAVEAYGCVALSLSYRLSPEHKFPTASDDCWDALQWVTTNAKTLGADMTQGFVLGGTSAGGNIAIVLSHLARDANLTPPITGLWLNVPLVLAPEVVPRRWRHLYRSREQNAQAPILNKDWMDLYTKAYAPDTGSHLWSPFNWPGPEPHSRMPPTHFQICGLDVLRDEALIYERVLRREYGTPTRVDIYPGLPHMFAANFPEHSASKKYLVDTIRGIGWLLGL